MCLKTVHDQKMVLALLAVARNKMIESECALDDVWPITPQGDVKTAIEEAIRQHKKAANAIVRAQKEALKW